MKFKRIAVIIRGHVRTWDWCKQNIFFTYGQLAEQIEWYFVTWQTPDLNLIKLKQDFVNKNLIDLVAVPISWYNYFNVGPQPYGQHSGPWYSPAWLSFNILPSKKIRQQQVNYDVVFDQRPDALSYISDMVFTKISPNSVYCINSQSEIFDIGFMSDSNTYDKLASRFTYEFQNQDTPESALFNFCNISNIKFESGFFDYTVIRPDIFNYFPDPLINISYNQWSNIKNISGNDMVSTWGKLSKDVQLEILKKYNISFWDYFQKDYIRKDNGFKI